MPYVRKKAALIYPLTRVIWSKDVMIYRSHFIVCFLILLFISLTACDIGRGGVGSSARLSLSLSGGPRTLSSHTEQPGQASAFARMTSIRIVIKGEDDRTFIDADLVTAGGSLEAEVPANIPLFIQGSAYEEGDEPIYQSFHEIAALQPGINRALTLIFTPVGALTAKVVLAPVQVDVTVSEQSADDTSSQAVFTGDNRQVLFRSLASNLADGDSNNAGDVFIKDLVSGVITNMHAGENGDLANDSLLTADMSADGNVIVFASDASNLVAGDSNEVSDIFIKDLSAATIERISVGFDQQQSDQASDHPVISADGRTIVFHSNGALTEAGAGGIYLLRSDESQAGLVHVDSGDYPQLSGDGQWLVYWQPLNGEGFNGRLMLYDVEQDERREITRYVAATPPQHRINDDGRYVVFNSTTSFDAADTDDAHDIYRYDREGHKLSLLSTDRDGLPLAGDAQSPDVSADGAYAVFTMGDGIFIKQGSTGETARLAQSGHSVVISPNGQLIAYSLGADGHLYVAANPLFVQQMPADAPVAPTLQPVPEYIYQLTVQVNGDGTVSSNDQFIDCGTQCSHIYGEPASVTLTAAPGETMVFSGWSGSCSGSNLETVVQVDGVRSCRANFATVATSFSVSVNVSGLAGSGLVLQNNGVNDLAIPQDGVWFFSQDLTAGAAYNVTVSSQPSALSQICVVTGGSGAIANADVNNIAINCTTQSYTLGGTVTGLSGSGLQLQINGSEVLAVTPSETGTVAFQFTQALIDGSNYNVLVLTQPSAPDQLCGVTNGGGVLQGSAVTNISISCVTATTTHSISGSVEGLQGSGLILQNNSGDNLPITTNGVFSFGQLLANGSNYQVTVLTQPSGLNQTCTVSNGAGTLTGADINNVSVVCTTVSYAVGGSVAGLAGGGLQLQNNGGDTLTIPAGATTFQFGQLLPDGSAYAVTVLIQPGNPNQTCSVVSGAGVIAGADVGNISISCSTTGYTLGGSITGLAGNGLQLQNGSEILDVATGSTGFQFSTPLSDGSSYDVTVLTHPDTPYQICTVTNGAGVVTGGAVSSVSVTCVAGMVINSFAAVPDIITAGDSAALQVSYANGSGTIDNGVGPVTASDSVPVAPTVTTDYTLTVSDAVGRSINQTTRVTVVAAPVITSFTASPLSVSPGASVTLTTNFSNGSGSIDNAVGAVNSGDAPVVNPTATTTYRLTVTNTAGRQVFQDVTVTVVAASYTIGGSVTGLAGILLLDNNGAEKLSVSANGNFTFSTPLADGQSYNVTVSSPPANQTCIVSNGSGVVAGVDISGISVSCSTLAASLPRYVYASNLTDNSISIYSVNAATGQLRHRGFTTTGSTPQFIATDPAGRFAYAVNYTANTLSAYTINADTGALTKVLPDIAAASGPLSITVHPNGMFAYVANFFDHTVSAYAINAGTGALTGIGSAVAAGTNPYSVAIHPTGDFAYVVNNNSDDISTYSINTNTGALTSVGLTPTTGTKPIYIAVHPNGKFAYVPNYSTATVSAYAIDPTTGVLSSIGTPLATGLQPYSIALDPQGRFAYVPNMTANTVSAYAIDAATGELTSIGAPIAAGTGPRFAIVDPGGEFVHVTNYGSSDITTFRINAVSGALTRIASVRGRAGMSGIALVSGSAAVRYTPKFAYTMNLSADSISVFTINNTTGVLASAGPDVPAGDGPTKMAIEPYGKFAYVTNSGTGVVTGTVSTFSIDQTTGILTSAGAAANAELTPTAVAVGVNGKYAYVTNRNSNSISTFSIAPGTGLLTGLGVTPLPATGVNPVRIIVHPNGKYAYTANYTSGNISIFSIDAATGQLASVGPDVAVGVGAAGAFGAIGIEIDASGRYAYAINYLSHEMSAFSVSPDTGSLTALGSAIPTGTSPYNLSLHPGGEWAYVINQGGDSISAFAIDKDNGTLTDLGLLTAFSRAYGISVDPSGRFVYISGSSNQVTGYALDVVSGGLSNIGTPLPTGSLPYSVTTMGDIR